MYARAHKYLGLYVKPGQILSCSLSHDLMSDVFGYLHGVTYSPQFKITTRRIRLQELGCRILLNYRGRFLLSGYTSVQVGGKNVPAF
ncbi:Uncharacterized protein HZ326_10409 [Fusarium oxysporum f. sp. albedinis]|nr:Uncharacterized protein HZ326_10409 [Fusarium oxysporum f. sp. albedinis]